MATRNVVLATFYFDLCESYSLYTFLPHCAMVLWEAAQKKVPPCGPNRAVDAVCFMLAQKMTDTTVFTICDLADVFLAKEEDVRACERRMLTLCILLPTIRPDRTFFARLVTLDPALHDLVKQFFHLALIGTIVQPFRRLALTHRRMCPQSRHRLRACKRA